MPTARVFKCGNSQAVRLPKGFTVEGREVEIFHRGREIVLREPVVENVARAFELLGSLPDDFLPVRSQKPPQVRDGL